MANPPKTPVTTTSNDAPARLSEDAGFEGKWKGADVSIQGRFEGELTLTGQLRVGRSGSVLGRVRADLVEIGGEFTGEVQARLIVMTETARARGTFVSERLCLKEGAVVDGAFDRPKTAVGTATVPVRPIPDKEKPQAETSSSAPEESAKPATSETAAVKAQGPA
jgi:cytoskeletal protein CcmA (bactofilin family)